MSSMDVVIQAKTYLSNQIMIRKYHQLKFKEFKHKLLISKNIQDNAKF